MDVDTYYVFQIILKPKLEHAQVTAPFGATSSVWAQNTYVLLPLVILLMINSWSKFIAWYHWMDFDTSHGLYVFLEPKLEPYQVVGLASICVDGTVHCCSCLKYQIK